MYKDKGLTYAQQLLELDANSSNRIISNGNQNHARDLFYQIIIGAKTCINIISSKLELYDSEKNILALNKAIGNKVNIKILLDGIPENSNIFLQLCLKNPTLCEIRQSKTAILSHIITRDNQAYRYCDIPKSDRAIASFNDDRNIISNSNKRIFDDKVFHRFAKYKNIARIKQF